MPAPLTLTVAEAADELGVAPARIRALLGNGALTAQPVPTGVATVVLAGEVADLARRGTVRSLDIAAVESALDRALRRRLPDLLDASLTAGLSTGLAPVAGELAVALGDIEAAAARAATAEQQTAAAQAELSAARARIRELEAQVTALEVTPVGLFRRRRVVVTASPA